MTRRTVAVGSNAVTINTDDAQRPELYTWAVLRTRVVDELTGNPPHVPLNLICNVPRCTPRVGSDGLCGFVARPRDVAHALLRPNTWTARVEAPGYLTHDLTPAIERARRQLGFGVVPPVTLLQLAAPVASDAEQFIPGRGAFVERNVNLNDEFGIARATAPPPPLGDIPLANVLQEPHAAGRSVAGVPLLLPDRPLHRARPARIRGRVQRRIPGPPAALVPAGAASIAIRGVWETYNAVTTAPPVPVRFCTIVPPLYFDFDVGTAVDGTTANAGGAPRAIRARCEIGARVLSIAPNGGLNPAGGDRLRIEDPASPEHEIVVSDGFDVNPDPAGTVDVRLRTPTAYIHRPDAVVRDIAAGPLVPAGTTTREAQRGDESLFAGNLAALPTTGAIIVAQGTVNESWHVATQAPTTPNDATFQNTVPIQLDGRFEWPAIARVAQLRVRALHAGYLPLLIDFALDYEGENELSIVFIN